MTIEINPQKKTHMAFYAFFGVIGTALIVYYLSNTIIYFTTPQQFPINSFKRFPLTFLIFPAEFFSFGFSLYFVYNLIHGNYRPDAPRPFANKHGTRIAVLLPVYNEPEEIVARTIKACRSMIWPGGKKVYLLDDSTNESDRQNMNELSRKFGCTLVRRDNRTGYKAGNINNAISTEVKEDFFVIFDSDQAPEPEFLLETMNFFNDPKVAFVQAPQHFVNNGTPLERAAKMGTNIFYHSQCLSKARDGAMPFCGTNVVVRTDVFRLLKGFSYYTSTEDIELGLRINQEGYHGAYVPKILAHGYAPTHYGAYASQQYRWANGNLAILRESWIRILFGKFSLRHQIHTIFTLGWWLVGIVTLIYIAVPILSFFFGGTHHTWLPTAMLGLLFLNVALGVIMIFASLNSRVEEEKVSFSDAFLQYSLITNSAFIYAKAAASALFKRYIGFVRTSKQVEKSGIWNIKWNLITAAICFGFSIYALYRSAIASDIQQLRTYFPVSLWLLFYTVTFGSSILFIGAKPQSQPLVVPDISRVASARGNPI